MVLFRIDELGAWWVPCTPASSGFERLADCSNGRAFELFESQSFSHPLAREPFAINPRGSGQIYFTGAILVFPTSVLHFLYLVMALGRRKAGRIAGATRSLLIVLPV